MVFLFCESMNLEIEAQFSGLILERLPAISTGLCLKHGTAASYRGFQGGDDLPISPLAEKSKS